MTEAAYEDLKQRGEALGIIIDEGVADVLRAARRWQRLAFRTKVTGVRKTGPRFSCKKAGQPPPKRWQLGILAAASARFAVPAT